MWQCLLFELHSLRRAAGPESYRNSNELGSNTVESLHRCPYLSTRIIHEWQNQKKIALDSLETKTWIAEPPVCRRSGWTGDQGDLSLNFVICKWRWQSSLSSSFGYLKDKQEYNPCYRKPAEGVSLLLLGGYSLMILFLEAKHSNFRK